MPKIKISIPQGSKLLLKEKDKVDFDQEIFELETNQTIDVNVAEKLSVDPSQIFTYLTKVIGDKVDEDEPIAAKKGLIGKKYVKSPKNGRISAIDHIKGTVSISYFSNGKDEDKDEESAKAKAGFIGIIDKISSGSMILDIDSNSQIPLKSISADMLGKTYYFDDDKLYFTLSEDEISEKIVIIEDLKTHVAAKCEALGTVGFILENGEENSGLPYAKLDGKSSVSKLFQARRTYAAASKSDKKLLLYG